MGDAMNPIEEVRPSKRPAILAIIPHYGSAPSTLEAVQSLLDQQYDHLSILLIDNSDEESGEGLAEIEWPADLEMESPGGNLGYCAAINRGLARAIEKDIPYLCFVNTDVRIEPDCLTRLVEALEAEPDLAGVGPLLTTDGGKHVWSAGSSLRFGPNEIAHRAHGRPSSEAPSRPAHVDFLAGALALYRTRDLELLGGLDVDYFMYCEDVDLGLRLSQGGRRLLYVPWARAEHQGTASSGGGASPLRKFLMGVNTPRFLRRAGSLRLWSSFCVFDLLGWFPALLLYLPRPRRLAAHLAKGRGLWMGIRGYRPGARDVEHYLGEGR